jgi:hypothetical protein
MDAGRITAALAKIEQARRMLDEGVRELAAATSVVATSVVSPRSVRRPPGASDDLAAARAKRILRAHGFVPTRER